MLTFIISRAILSVDNERKLLIRLTEKGQSRTIEAEGVPCAMENCIPLEREELLQLRTLLKKALARMTESKA